MNLLGSLKTVSQPIGLMFADNTEVTVLAGINMPYHV